MNIDKVAILIKKAALEFDKVSVCNVFFQFLYVVKKARGFNHKN